MEQNNLEKRNLVLRRNGGNTSQSGAGELHASSAMKGKEREGGPGPLEHRDGPTQKLIDEQGYEMPTWGEQRGCHPLKGIFRWFLANPRTGKRHHVLDRGLQESVGPAGSVVPPLSSAKHGAGACATILLCVAKVDEMVFLGTSIYLP